MIFNKKILFPTALLLYCLTPILAFAATGESRALAEMGRDTNMFWALPFAGLILSLALAPLFFQHLWDRHFDKVTLFWIALIILPLLYIFGIGDTVYLITEMVFYEYLPFIILLTTLFIIAGGVTVEGYFDGRPHRNLIMLVVGSVLASFMGTMGAAMLLVRPMLRVARLRKHNVHLVVFFIILVCNIGGALTPLGDPPLFLGFLRGVDFFWTLIHLWPAYLLATSILLTLFYMVDLYFWKKEKGTPKKVGPLKMDGLHNFLFLGGVIATLLLSAEWDNNFTIPILGVPVPVPSLARDVIFLTLAFLSYRTTSEKIHKANSFNFAPPKELAILFFGIFVTLLPVIAILGGAGGEVVSGYLTNRTTGESSPAAYFFLTGIFSSFLDNAPTYLVFYELAGGEANFLMTEYSHILAAISLGAVFMGANSYIGNAPNFMVKTLSYQFRVKTPHFFGYVFYSWLILLPIYILIAKFILPLT